MKPAVKIFSSFFVLGLLSTSAQADVLLNVSIDTSSLAGMSGSEVFFELTDGSGTAGDSNNTATLSGFSLGGGVSGALDTFFGGVAPASNLGSTVSITDSSFLNLFGQFFTPGAVLSFALNLTTNVDAGGTPDQFSMYIYDPSQNPLATTTDPTGFDSLLSINIDSTTPITNDYATSLVSAVPGSVPEPGALLPLILGFAGLGALRRAAHRVVG